MDILDLLDTTQLAASLDEALTYDLAPDLSALVRARVYPRSISPAKGCLYFLINTGSAKMLACLSHESTNWNNVNGTVSTIQYNGHDLHLARAPIAPATSQFLRQALDWLQPRTLGPRKS